MKILTTQQIRACDAYTIRQNEISSWQLMERAGAACVQWIHGKYKNEIKTFHIFCGPGNNGGDGLVIARLLKGRKVHVYLPENLQSCSLDFKTNYERLVKCNIEIHKLDAPQERIKEEHIIIDALFGSGLTRPLDGPYKNLVDQLNLLTSERISIDVPSGMYGDRLNDQNDTIMKADHCLTFVCPKLSFFIERILIV